jgi:hypothetical protein
MTILPRLSRRRLCATGLLLVATALVVVLVLTAPGPLDVAREKCQRIKVGMTPAQVRAILNDMPPGAVMSSRQLHVTWWYDPRSGATIAVDCDSAGRVTGVEFEEGDQSFPAQVGRLKDRLVGKLPQGRGAKQVRH